MALESSDGMSSSEDIGIFGQLGDSFKGILTGIVLFPASLFLIYQIETCEQASAALKGAVPAAQAQAGLPSYVTGTLTADSLGGEFVRSGHYISYSQTPEVFAWTEEVKEEGSGTSKKKVRTCKLEWTSSPKNPRNFELAGCKSKPFYQASHATVETFATGGKVKGEDGKAYSVNLKEVDYTSEVPSVVPEASHLTKGILKDEYVYLNEKCSKDELEGCERVSVEVRSVPTESMTFVGAVSGHSIGKFKSKEDNLFLNASVGDFQKTMKDIANDDKMMRWIGRGVSFVLIWVSLNLLVGPLTALLSFIPLIGEFGKMAISFVLGIVAFVVTAITILLVKFWYIWLLLGLVAIGYGFYKKRQAKPA
ncbi:PF07787 family protein [Leptospira broomii serovar Hurstbridge str. 5399]|uniref:PF07787 family protein n=1 Tax=Leptospira broomii serovar Hurstbridge str. 5399 TaxID=1049789 RepID=T0FDZ3_9LEPT|nr:TMEM43 family protein [Leptospira broomii]EQA46071.1 PF07787 family protein [Leptospira broomii serovar Hurstbridge str. 5399]